MKMQQTLLAIISFYTIFHQVSSEYCHYFEAKHAKDNRLYCEYSGSYEELEGISLLHLKHDTTIHVLKKALFSPFKNLKTLYITAANVESIEPGAFDGFNLEMVDLYQNKLKNIDNGTFNTLSNLKYLDLSHNKFKSLKDHAFTGLTSLEWLSLNSNKIKKISKGTFNHTKNLRALYLHSNEILQLDVDTFQNLFYLELLDLSFNSLIKIHFGIFTDHVNLQTLLLQHNQLEDLPDRVFDNATSLKILDVSENNIQEIQNNLFHRTKRLEILKFSSNNVSEFNSTFLVNHAPNLQEIYLFHNQWKCNSLKKIVEDFEKKKVFIATETPVLTDTVYGIGCWYN